ncbi:MAG: 50S ribosomal protein L11 methyltransferase [Bacteroidaceae bacterium]|nr:50S ribosomal protein L11 methyltransferase [Bacteroidaceae bacterium]
MYIINIYMKYYEVDFVVTPYNEDCCDVLQALLGNIGFESFVSKENGVLAYVQKRMFDASVLRELIETFPLPDYHFEYSVAKAPDEDWNAVWEKEFAPVIIDDLVCVHDTRHPVEHHCQHDIVINPRLAFGTGTHPTTRMILSHLSTMDLRGKRVIDAGTGTGVLGILCHQLGATEIVGYDIDEWSVENATMNALLNSAPMEVLFGDADVLNGIRPADMLIANINRNILLGDMSRFAQALKPHACLLLSGFYEQDIPSLTKEAEKFGFVVKNQKVTDDWAMICLER